MFVYFRPFTRYLYLIIFLSSLGSTSIWGQKFYLPHKMLLDSNQLNPLISKLSKQVISFYKSENKELYLDNLFRFQNVAEDYKNSIFTLDSLCDLYSTKKLSGAKGIGFAFRTFSEAKLLQAQNSYSFAVAFQKAFIRLYDSLDELEKSVADKNFDYDINSIRNRFEYFLKNQESTDSISFETAKEICRAYNSYNVYRHVLPLGKQLLKTIEKDNYIVEDSILIKMRDGSILSATVVRTKKDDRPKPVIFNFSIYPGPTDKANAKLAAIKGYVGIVVNTRGKRLSPQNIEPFEHDANDAYDIIDWISKQSWCNGKIGMYGGSYLGFSQWAAVKTLHPALKTIVPQVPVGIGVSFPMVNSVFKSYMLSWIHYVTNNKQTDEPEFNNSKYWNSVYTKWYVSGQPFRNLDSIEGRRSEIFQRWIQHPDHDSYWQSMVPYKMDFSKINIPILTTTGYYDVGQLGSLYYFKEHYKFNKNADHFLVIGPFDHVGAQGTPASELMGYKPDSIATINITNLTFKWFDYILKDSVKPPILKNKINYEVMGANQWKHVSSFGEMNNDTLRFYFSNIQVGKYYKLIKEKPLKEGFTKQEVNLSDRSDTSNLDYEKIISDAIKTGENLSFISAPFDHTISINGSFFGEIKAIANKMDFDLNIQLFELLPDGKYFKLSSFLGRVSYIDDRTKRRLLQPGKIESILFTNSWFISKKINAGSRLVVLVGINKNKYWQINYGTGKDVSNETIQDGKVPLEIKWMNDSYLNIPIWRDK